MQTEGKFMFKRTGGFYLIMATDMKNKAEAACGSHTA